MTLQNHIFGTAAAALAASGALTASSPAAACTPPRLGPSVAVVSAPWRQAVEALRQEAASVGQPWSCTGGALDIAERDGGARLTVTGDDGRTFSREVTAPDDVVPLGEAMLARPDPMPALAPPDAPPRDVVTPPAAAPAVSPPRVLLSAVVAPRYAGGAALMLGGITAAASLPFGAWIGGAWLRYDGVSTPLDPRASRLTEVCIGAAAGRTFGLGPVELRTSLLGSVAVATRPGFMMSPDETHVSGRVGLDARGVIPINRTFRAVVALDAELDPRQIAEGSPSGMGMKGPPPLPGFPSYTLGAGVGMEIALR